MIDLQRLVVVPCTFLLLSLSEAPAFPVIEQESGFMDGSTRLACTLFLPESDGPCPAVVLLNGSNRGPRSAYLREVASKLAARGMAALIYDSPGTGQSGGTSAFLQTRADRVEEALAAFRFLKGKEGLLPEQIGLFGISEGAPITLLAAAREKTVAFVIPVSCSMGLSPTDLSRFRVEKKGRTLGLDPVEIDKAKVFQTIFYTLLSGQEIAEWSLLEAQTSAWTNEPWKELLSLARAWTMDRRERGSGGLLTGTGFSEARQEEALALLKSAHEAWKETAWYELAIVNRARMEQFLAMGRERFFAFLQMNPLARGDWNHPQREAPLFLDVACPVLALYGEDDDYLPPRRSAAVLKDDLSRSRCQDFTIKVFPRATHTLAAFDGSDAFADGFFDVMLTWLEDRVDLPFS